MIGTYHNVSKEYLPLYLVEFQFRYKNLRNADIFAFGDSRVLSHVHWRVPKQIAYDAGKPKQLEFRNFHSNAQPFRANLSRDTDLERTFGEGQTDLGR